VWSEYLCRVWIHGKDQCPPAYKGRAGQQPLDDTGMTQVYPVKIADANSTPTEPVGQVVQVSDEFHGWLLGQQYKRGEILFGNKR